MKYVVVVSRPVYPDDEIEEEYTGIEYASRNEAREEFFRAKADINWESAWIKEVEQ